MICMVILTMVDHCYALYELRLELRDHVGTGETVF